MKTPIAWRWLTLAAGLALAAASVRGAPPAGGERPAVVLIVVDDLGYGELGSYGGTEIPTPHLDRLAAEGVRFTQGYVTASFCAPSRAALLTGRYQTRFGYEGNPTGARNADPRIGLPGSERTIAERLQAAGYATALVGKWHLGGTAAFHPQRRGFDTFFGFLHEGHSYVPPPYTGVTAWWRRVALPDGGKGRWVSPDGRTIWTTHMGNKEPDYDADNPLLRGSQPVDEPANLTDAFSREAADVIRRKAGQPFFLYLAYNAVHSPMQAEDAYLARFAHIPDIHRRIFAAMLSQLDDGVGRVLAQVRESGIEERTLVILLADNGGATRELTSRNTPLRGEKGTLFEGGIRVPMLLRWPARVPGGRVWASPVIATDLAATELAAAGVKEPGQRLDGDDLTGRLTARGDPAAPRTLYWRMGLRGAIRHGDWKLMREPDRGASGPWRLYDLAADPGESTDLAEREPGRVAELTALWEAWSAQQAPPLF
jgi:arylsulfatase A-like enzyme